jgi:hypothetical protein
MIFTTPNDNRIEFAQIQIHKDNLSPDQLTQIRELKQTLSKLDPSVTIDGLAPEFFNITISAKKHLVIARNTIHSGVTIFVSTTGGALIKYNPATAEDMKKPLELRPSQETLALFGENVHIFNDKIAEIKKLVTTETNEDHELMSQHHSARISWKPGMYAKKVAGIVVEKVEDLKRRAEMTDSTKGISTQGYN